MPTLTAKLFQAVTGTKVVKTKRTSRKTDNLFFIGQSETHRLGTGFLKKVFFSCTGDILNLTPFSEYQKTPFFTYFRTFRDIDALFLSKPGPNNSRSLHK